MRRVLIRGLTVAIVLMAATAVQAVSAPAAAPVQECGNYGVTRDGAGPMWTFRQIDGAGTYNLTTRRVSCSTGRGFWRRWHRQNRDYRRVTFVSGYRCTDLAYGAYESADIRCTASRGQVIRWQEGA